MAIVAGAVFAIGAGAGAGLDAARGIPGMYRPGPPAGGDVPTDEADIVIVRVTPAVATIGVDPSRDAAM